MEAYYYRVTKNDTSEIVDEGIIRNSEDTIYPQQNTGITELPFQCECHHFKAESYTCTGTYFQLNYTDIIKNRVK